MFSKIKVEYLP